MTAARAEQARAMDAASQLSDASGDSGNPALETAGSHLPGGRKLETGGARSTPAAIMVSTCTSPFAWSPLSLYSPFIACSLL